MDVAFILYLAQQPRELETVLPVYSLAEHVERPVMAEQTIRGVQICYRFSGNAETAVVEIDGKRYEARYPVLLIKRPGETHRSPSPERNSGFYFTYRAEALDELRARGLDDDLVMCELPQTPEIAAGFRQLRELAKHAGEFGAADRIDMLSLRLFQEFLLARKKHQSPLEEEDEKLRRIVSHLQRNFLDEIDLDELAKGSGFSRRTFSRRWARTGLPPPAQYLFELRMAEAKRLLTETALPVWEISQRLRYRGSAWFCAAFRRHTGETPLQYRRRQR